MEADEIESTEQFPDTDSSDNESSVNDSSGTGSTDTESTGNSGSEDFTPAEIMAGAENLVVQAAELGNDGYFAWAINLWNIIAEWYELHISLATNTPGHN